MELLSLQYQSKGGIHKDLLLIYLGEYDNKIVGVDATIISDDERTFILKNAQQIENMPLKMVTGWLKTYCPQAYKKGFKTLASSKAKILSRHKVKISV